MHPSELFNQPPDVKKMGIEKPENGSELHFDPKIELTANDFETFEDVWKSHNDMYAFLKLGRCSRMLDFGSEPILEDRIWSQALNCLQQAKDNKKWERLADLLRFVTSIDPERTLPMHRDQWQELADWAEQIRGVWTWHFAKLVLALRRGQSDLAPLIGEEDWSFLTNNIGQPTESEFFEHLLILYELDPERMPKLTDADWQAAIETWSQNKNLVTKVMQAASMYAVAKIEAAIQQPVTSQENPTLPITKSF